MWSEDLILRNDTIPDGRHSDGWPTLLSNSGVSGPDVNKLVQLTVDLNGDGITDPVFVARGVPSLLAVNGANGKVLWWYRARPTLPDGRVPMPKEGKWNPSAGTVVGMPAVADVNNDGSPDLIATFIAWADSFHPPSGPNIRVNE